MADGIFARLFQGRKNVEPEVKLEKEVEINKTVVIEETKSVSDGLEIIAVISAAIAAIGEAEGKNLKITGISSKGGKPIRSGWSYAGLMENMRCFH